MPKAPSYPPKSADSRKWYTHTPEDRPSLSRTSTRDMYDGPFDQRNIRKVSASQPRVFYSRINHQKPVFKHCNDFTAHDNRNDFQGHGVHFGMSRAERALGKRLPPGNHHSTRPDFLGHPDGSRYGYDYRTTHTTAFAPLCVPVMPAIFRRFPRSHTSPDLLLAEPPTCTADYAPLPPCSITTETLGQSQIPYAGHNSWRYCYNREVRAYPDLPALRAQLPPSRSAIAAAT